jgi:hypothetical protein
MKGGIARADRTLVAVSLSRASFLAWKFWQNGSCKVLLARHAEPAVRPHRLTLCDSMAVGYEGAPTAAWLSWT